MSSTILVTGGAGYIGSHACVALIEAGFAVVVLDNFCNASAEAVRRVETITDTSIPLVEGDVRDAACLDALFAEHDIAAVMHFAGLKAVGESMEKPLEYYDNNVNGTLVLLAAMARAGVNRIIFSSSATVYGDPDSVPIREDFPTSATNPYGRSKLMVEEILADWDAAHPDWSIGRLRYFNPVGAHASGRIGEDPQGWPNNLMPFVAQVAVGRREKLSIFGGDYPTPDGTGVRDYIHVVDLAEGHVAALRFVLQNTGLLTVNLGTGKGASVLDMVRAFESACGKEIPCQIVERRAGDIAECWADPAMAESLLGWKATRSLQQMCADTWRWQEANPSGYG
ncbi:UDP-glucose 4-epimerase GalE [Pseudohalioglobus lutimaris]|uniref:UDP-glucose 4-epimerase n=1 Tax=Pseudohalioglobus lutimaris TaxID=1737061 RepID=A0A2N5X280_9GAMM|nr:UDP-glucose 4-epimerase GalE [Pseudohalioglobus lutimaris]PLW68583.1 UDP-glucose 4-epimerase GalE [Pseudohalioglobus lutimaris]